MSLIISSFLSRFANLPAGAKITLKTGHERVLGFREAPPPVPPQPSKPTTAVASASQNLPSDPPTQHSIPNDPPVVQPAVATTPNAQPVVSPAPAVAPVEPSAPNDGSHIFAGRPIHVFTRESEAEEDAARVTFPLADLDEAAYEVTEADLRAQLAGYARRQAQEGKHLMTKAMREAEAARKAASYGSVPIRVEFPNNFVLQASFPAVAPVAELRELVEAALTPETAAGFYLFTTPPKTELKDMSQSFYAAGLVPAARVHVGLKGGEAAAGGSCLRPEVVGLVDKPPTRAVALGVAEKNAAGGSNEAGPSGSKPSPASGQGASGSAQGEPKRKKAGGVPSWMKLSTK